jgi:hypothetical protein
MSGRGKGGKGLGGKGGGAKKRHRQVIRDNIQVRLPRCRPFLIVLRAYPELPFPLSPHQGITKPAIMSPSSAAWLAVAV